jgi:hypothetical protein
MQASAASLADVRSGAHAMNHSESTPTTEQIRLERRLPSYWRVTFDIRPLNIFGPNQIPQLNEVDRGG